MCSSQDIDPDVEIMARAIAATQPGGPATWRLYVREAQAARAVLGERLTPVEWEYAHRRMSWAAEITGPPTTEEKARRFAEALGGRVVRRRPAGPWEEVGLDPDVREDVDLDARHEHGKEDRERDAADRGRR